MDAAFSAGSFAVAAFSAAAFAFGIEQPAGGGGGTGKPKRKVYPTFYNPGPLIEPARRPVEESEALLLCVGGL